MGYIKKAVQTGVEFAESYQMPEYVAKARESSKIVDVASEKIQTFYCEKGSPLLQMVDELTAAKINNAFAVANNSVEQAQKLKTAAADKVYEKFEIAKETKDIAVEKTTKKIGALKIEASKKVDETKTIVRKRAIYASEEACRIGDNVEKKLKETASKNEYADKVLSVVFSAKDQVKAYGEALVQKSLALPLTLQERMEKGLSFAKEQVKIGSAKLEMKKAEFKTYVLVSYGKMTSDNALNAVNTVFGEKAALKAREALQKLQKANLKQKVSDEMKKAYCISICQVKSFADFAEKMEEKYVGSTLVFKAKAKFSGK